MNEYTREEGGEEVQDGEGVNYGTPPHRPGSRDPSQVSDRGRRARLVNELQISFDAPEPSAAYQP